MRGRLTARGVVAAILTAPWLAWAIVRTFGLDSGHPVVAAMSLTPLVAALSPLPILVAAVLRRWVVTAVALLSAIMLVAAVAPRAITGSQLVSDAPAGRTLVVMTSNLYLGRADAAAIVALVRRHHVDVLSLQELTPEAVGRLDRAGIRGLLAQRVLDARADASGTGLMARGALRRTGHDASGPHAEPEATLTMRNGHTVHVKAVHPVPPISAMSAYQWREDLRALPGPTAGRSPAAARPAATAGVPRMLVGDFNATLDQRELRRVLDRGFYDAADATGDGLLPTWPIGNPRPVITIDHILLPDTIAVHDLNVYDVAGSDHRAVIATLVLPR